MRLEPEEGAFLGALALNYGVAGLAFIGLLVGWLAVTLPDVQIVPLMIASVAVVVIVPILFLSLLQNDLGGPRSVAAPR